ncbi:hypothetical protein CJ030_MR5G003616 [Morella rubra]|uniref:Uncharacterized protein n=1 Tax=Morella rubra TaxID=262757 RepID=A0A6A1VKP4_9ROSI|nr:hypothetical protein CJ030_MR5G003616 [Morella rubra]
MRIEKFLPPHLDPTLAIIHSQRSWSSPRRPIWNTGKAFSVQFQLMPGILLQRINIKVTMYARPFTTRRYFMNQRLLVLATVGTPVWVCCFVYVGWGQFCIFAWDGYLVLVTCDGKSAS